MSSSASAAAGSAGRAGRLLGHAWAPRADVVGYNLSPLVFVLALAIADVVWAGAAQVQFAGAGRIGANAVLLVLVGMSWRALRRLRIPGEALGNLGVWLAAMAAILPLSYLCAHTSAPLNDARLIAADGWFGFDWRQWAVFVDSQPWLDRLFYLSYRTLLPQAVVVCGLLALIADRGRAAEFMWIVTVTGVLCCLISALVPAEGARPFHGIGHADWIDDLNILRQAGPARFEMHRMHGIVTFPSFHAAISIIYIWAMRRTWLSPVAIVLNLTMLASTPTEGGHYLVDLLAGSVVALAVIVAVGRLRARYPVAFEPAPARSTACMTVAASPTPRA